MGVGDEYSLDTVNGGEVPDDIDTLGVFLPAWAEEDATFLGWLDEQDRHTLQEELGYDARDIAEMATAYAETARPGSDGSDDAAVVKRVDPYVAQRGVDPQQLRTDIRKWHLQQKADYLWGGTEYSHPVEHDTLRHAVEHHLVEEHAPISRELDRLQEQYFAWSADLEQQLRETRREEAPEQLEEDLKELIDDAFDAANNLLDEAYPVHSAGGDGCTQTTLQDYTPGTRNTD